MIFYQATAFVTLNDTKQQIGSAEENESENPKTPPTNGALKLEM